MSTPADALLRWIDRRRLLLALLLAASLLLAFNGRWRIGPDASLYVSLGRGIAAGQGYHSAGWRRGNAHFGLPYLLAINFRLFGPQTFWPAVAMIFAMGAAALACVYGLMRIRLPRPLALAVTLLTGGCFTFAAHLYELLTDTPGFLGIMAALWAFEALTHGPPATPGRRAAWLALLVAGLWLGATMRPVAWALMAAMAAVAVAGALRNPAWRWRALATVTLIAAALLLFYLVDPRRGPSAEAHEAWLRKVLLVKPGETLRTIWSHTLGMILGPTTTEAWFAFAPGALLSHALAVVLLAAALSAARHNPLWILWIAGNIVMLLIYPEPQTRYLLPILPFIALGFLRIVLALGRLPSRNLATAGMAACLAAWALPNAARLAGLVYRQHAADVAAIDHGRYVPFRQLAENLQNLLPPDAVVVCDDALALEAFAPARHFFMPIDDVAPQDMTPAATAALVDAGNLYMVETERKSTPHVLAAMGLTAGPPLLTVPRPAWELQRFPQRWLHPQPLPDLPPLVLRQVLRPPASTAEAPG
jgi:hypothetical protein